MGERERGWGEGGEGERYMYIHVFISKCFHRTL